MSGKNRCGGYPATSLYHIGAVHGTRRAASRQYRVRISLLKLWELEFGWQSLTRYTRELGAGKVETPEECSQREQYAMDRPR
jgi:hypothetical protein